MQPADVIDFCVRRLGNRLYLVAVNLSSSPVTATISIGNDAAALKQVNVLFENRHIDPGGTA